MNANMPTAFRQLDMFLSSRKKVFWGVCQADL